MSDGGLFERGSIVLLGANRDVVKLTDFGWDQTRINALDAALEAFTDLPTDIELSGIMMVATEAKNNLRKTITDYIMVEVMARVEQKYELSSGNYKRFGVSQIHNERDVDFYTTIKRVIRQATALLADLSGPGSPGLTQAIIDQLALYKAAFDTAMDDQQAAIEDRDKAVQDRVEAGNAIYKDMVKLADLGKRIWLGVDESKYNEYVLYPNSGGAEPPAQQVVESDVDAGQTVNLSVTGITETSVLQIENTGPTDLYVYFSAMPLDPPPPEMGPVPAGTSGSVTAADGGFASGSSEYLNVYNPGMETGHVIITVEE